jgi:hypothetical protein
MEVGRSRMLEFENDLGPPAKEGNGAAAHHARWSAYGEARNRRRAACEKRKTLCGAGFNPAPQAKVQGPLGFQYLRTSGCSGAGA